MADSPAKSVIVVGGGIVGLAIASAAQARGHRVTLIARDRPEDTASGVAAGMIAPALEAMNDFDPRLGFLRLTAAQAAWFDLLDLWPEPAQRLLAAARARSETFYCAEPLAAPEGLERLRLTGAMTGWLAQDDVSAAGFDPESWRVVRVTGDWLIEAATLLAALRLGLAVPVVTGEAVDVATRRVELATGEYFEADDVIIAAGYAGAALAEHVPSLARLVPIKGHLLDIDGIERYGVTRSPNGYYAGYGGYGKFGASMQEGRSDLAVEADIVTDLEARARALRIDAHAGIPRVGIRAASPDGWPMIGRDRASGVWVATAMRRNGYVFAPLAARMMLAFLDGETPSEAALYDPDRFS